ncbi:MAG: hypothetical protein RIT81_19630 [Deltaproteobacteria bacterium]
MAAVVRETVEQIGGEPLVVGEDLRSLKARFVVVGTERLASCSAMSRRGTHRGA